MMNSVIEWFSSQWLEIASVLIACAALFYARQAHHSSVAASEQQRAAELTGLRIQAQTGLDDAQRSLIALKTDCQANRSEWKTHEFRQGPMIGQMKPIFDTTPTDLVQHRGESILAGLKQSYSTLATKTTKELELVVNEARTASLQIMALAGELEPPPSYRK